MPQAEEQATFSPILRKNKKQLIGQRQHRRSTIRSEDATVANCFHDLPGEPLEDLVSSGSR